MIWRCLSRQLLTLVGVWALAGLVSASASATFPGRNGALAVPDDHNGYDLEGVLRVPPGASRLDALAPAATFFYGCDGALSDNGGCDAGVPQPNMVERASFSPDGKTLVTGTDGQIVFIDAADPSQLRTLPRLTQYDDAPAFLEGGERVVFAGRPPKSTRSGIYVVAVDGADLKLLTDNGSNPVGSPDGRWIAFQRAGAIWLMHPDGSDQHRLAKGSDPCFSPDGKHLVFSGRRIERIDLAGRHLRPITSQSGIPVWSPDGKQIAYTHNNLQTDTSQLWVMPASGGKRRLLAQDQAVSEDALNYVGFLAPDWQARPR